MRKRTQFAVAGIFVAMIFAPLIVGLTIGYKAREIENHQLIDFPAPLDLFSDTSFLYRFKGALGDHLPLRTEMVEVGAWVDLALFNHSYSPQVSVGQDDWLFLKRDVYARRADPVSPMADGIKRVGEALASHGIQFIFVIAPNKSAVYPEKLGTMLARASEASSKRRTEMQSLMAERAGTYFVDL